MGEAEREAERGGRNKEEKVEEKGNLAGERQSGDGQVRLTAPLPMCSKCSCISV